MGKPGPKTKVGKELVRLNAMKHGVFASTPVIPGLEREEDWEAHRVGVLESLQVDGYLEEAIAERIAHLLWRQQRLARYERDMITLAQEQVETEWWVNEGHTELKLKGESTCAHPVDSRYELQFLRKCLRLLQRLPKLTDDARLSGEDAATILLDVAGETEDVDTNQFHLPGIDDDIALEDFTRWTASLVRQGIEAIAAHEGRDPKDLLESAVAKARRAVSWKQFEIDRMEQDLDRMRRARLLPDGKSLEIMARHEAHLNRQFRHELHELEARQTRRQGGVAPLARVDVLGLQSN